MMRCLRRVAGRVVLPTVLLLLLSGAGAHAANRRLTGLLTGRVTSGRVPRTVLEHLALVPSGSMDGTWILAFELHRDGDAIGGLAWRTLSNGVVHEFVVTGEAGADGTAILSLIDAVGGFGSAPIRATITPLEGGWARIESFSAKGYGQVLSW